MHPWIQLGRDSAVPLYLQLYRALRDQMLAGALPAGTRLASSRQLAADLGVARNVVLGPMRSWSLRAS